MTLSGTTAALLKPAVVFLLFFIFVSGVIGSKVVDSSILFKDGFALYGGVGKALLFGGIALVLLGRRSQVHVPKLAAWKPIFLLWAIAALGLAAMSWIGIGNLIEKEGARSLNLLFAHGGLWGSMVLALLACIGWQNIRLLQKAYRKPLVLAGLLTLAFYVVLTGVYQLWQPLASVVLYSVDSLLGISGISATIIEPYTMMLDKFSVTVAEYCSGVESIALFTSLYAMVGLLDWPRIRRRRFFCVFPLALLVLFLFNIVRVYVLILAGYHIDPELAFNLFHTYAGMIFFILYSALFWVVSYKYLVKGAGYAATQTTTT